ncbi:MAG: diaminopimelate epimerase, partial [Alphaproteobacteria bacterium]|nr:diaminopimelate epimerase [Alphaproteobacteria bacterium]
MTWPFVKMNGLGNDFIVVADSGAPFAPTPAQIRALASREGPYGCDQVIAITRSPRAHAAMRIWNSSGEEVEHCGNGARCVAWLMMAALDLDSVRLDTASGVLAASRRGQWLVQVDMGEPRLKWSEIPLAHPADTLNLPADLTAGLLQDGGAKLGLGAAASMGNPHVTFFVADLDSPRVTVLGPPLETAPLFPQKVNVGFAEPLGPERLRLKVWERGAGLTSACGTGACAAVVNAVRRGLTGREVTVLTDGG